MELTQKQFRDFVKEREGTLCVACRLFSSPKKRAEALLGEVLGALWAQREKLFGEDMPIRFYRILIGNCLGIGPKRTKSLNALFSKRNDFEDLLDTDRASLDFILRLQSVAPIERAFAFLWFEGLGLSEISRIMGVDLETLPQKINKILSNLKK